VAKEKGNIEKEMKGWKERAKELEQEMEQLKGLENSSVFGNSMQQTKKYDFEVKRMKEMFTQQLQKAKEEGQKWRNQCKAAEEKV